MEHVLGLKIAHLVARSQLEGVHALIECLKDRRVWNQTPPRIQDLAIKGVGQILGPSYYRVETRSYQSGGQSHRIATFRYRLGRDETDKTSLIERLLDPYKKYEVELNLIPGGRFLMGSEAPAAEGCGASTPVHSALIRPFLMGRMTVTQLAWDRLGGEDTRRVRDPALPVHGISWDDCELWMAEAGGRLRFPSEAEWEYCCRAGCDSRYYWGDQLDAGQAWLASNSGRKPHKASEHQAQTNAFGLVDMAGNLREWCHDEFFEDYESGPNDDKPRGDLAGYEVKDRVLRGGDCESDEALLTSAARSKHLQKERSRAFGLRLARSLYDF